MMGYTITIGQAVFNPPEEIGERGYWSVESMELPEAPAFPDSGRRNTRSPSYTVWHDLSVTTGLAHLFADECRDEPLHLIPTYPCVSRLTVGHVTEIESALVRFKTVHPDAIPRCATSLFDREDSIGPYDAHLMRLEWLAWWVRWAVENCNQPAIDVG